MKHPLLRLLMVAAFLIGSSVLPLFERPACAGSETVEDQVAHILVKEASRGNIKVVIFNFSISSGSAEKKVSEAELKETGARFTEGFTANILRKIDASGKRDTIAIIDPGRLDDILREKKLPAGDLAERTAGEIGRITGMDVIVTGRASVSGNAVTATAKVVRVKDGEILGIAGEDRQEKPAAPAHAPITLIDAVEKIKIGDWKALPLHLASGGTLNLVLSVLRGNPIDAYVIPGSELENFKLQKEFQRVADFRVTKSKGYRGSADIKSGDYYLILRDSSLGVFSTQNSDIKITVQLEP